MAASANRVASPPPPAWLALTEFPRALLDVKSLVAAARLLTMAPRGDGHAVMILPGLFADDASTVAMRCYLRQLGYEVHAWELGRNIGRPSIGWNGEKLDARLRDIRRRAGGSVSLIGWSLGGIMARRLAARDPAAVRQIVTLGSPIRGNARAGHARRPYRPLAGDRRDRRMVAGGPASPTRSVPTTAIYTRGDGVVAWQRCLEAAGPTTESIEVWGSHIGLCVNPAVLLAVADRLSLPEAGWRPFDRSGLRRLIYPDPARA